MFKNPLYRQALKILAFFIVSMLLTRFSQGIWLGVMTLIGVGYALTGRTGKALAIYIMIIFMIGLNPILLPLGQFFAIFVRFGPLVIGLALMLKGMSCPGQSRVPFGLLSVYLISAAISSISGWAPLVSYLKIVNFLVFLLGFWFGIHTLGRDIEGMFYLRATFLALSAFTILGSVALLPFPEISTLSGMELALREGNVAAAEAAMISEEGTMPLLCGVTKQSQMLAPLAAIMVSWLIADMLFVEQRFEKPHLYMIIIALPLIYMTRSRIGLFTLAVGIFMVAINLVQKISLPNYIKKNLRQGVWVAIILGFAVICASEVRNRSISKWLRKTDDIAADTRSLTDAVTSSRQGLIDESMYDYRLNPLFGKGFQVSMDIADMVAQSGTGLILTAPIEKGVLPVMILGETGIVGCIFFATFLISFYVVSNRRKLYVTVALFTVLLATNMGEATFFSPGGGGGVFWAICVIGGYCIDMTLAHDRKRYANLPYNHYP